MTRIEYLKHYIYLPLIKVFFDPFTETADSKEKSFGQKVTTTLRYRLGAVSSKLCFPNERNLRKYLDKHKGERCFIIGNGPSLNDLDLTKLKNEYTFGVNAIYTNYEKMGFYPTYYVLEDTLVAEDRAEEINNYKDSWKFIGNHLSYCIKSDEKTVWLNTIMDYRDYPNFPNFSKNALRKIWVGGTVTYQCLQLAYFMGFSRVYLIGFDHNYVVPNTVKKRGTKFTSTEDDMNHFDKDYFGRGKRWHDPQVDRMELAYEKAKKCFEASGRSIYNASYGGKLEVFKRVKYNSIFKSRKKM